MSQPLVSIIMPVYNVERYVKEAIDSALNQTYPHLELIVMNDGSSDGTADICRSYTDPRVRYYENPANMGVLRTRNEALKLVRGEYVAWLDSDDISLPTRLEKQVSFLEANPDYVMCGTLHQDIDGEGRPLLKSYFPCTDKDLRSFLLLVNSFCNSSTMVRGPLMQELRFAEDCEVAEDYDLWIRLAQQGKLANIPEFLTLYRVHGNNISITKKDRMFAIVKTLAGRILTDAGVHYTPEELEIHSKMLSFAGPWFGEQNRLKALEDWVISIYNQLSTKKIYNNSLLFALLAERWQVACIQNKRFARIFFNRVLIRNFPTYCYVLACKILKKPIRY